ncbi:MAG: hypothetical protein GF363_15525 [Chitinivibrionales bacterium]|nr:hypothetical protein [Chitinivibrionales bacterium]
MPRRIMRGDKIPISLVVNDVDKYPIEIQSVTIVITQGGQTRTALETVRPTSAEIPHPLARYCRAFIFWLSSSDLQGGRFHVNCKAIIAHNGGKRDVVLNDNLPTTSKAPFVGWLTEEPLPGSDRAAYGDLHVHSHYSRSHVEFGPPVAVIDYMAKAYGLDFAALTDHSYDLASRTENFLAYDPNAERWGLMLAEASKSKGYSTNLIVGEEVSSANAQGKTVHLCGLGLRRFVPGSRDGARFNAPKNSTLSLPEAIGAIHAQGGLAMAAHPGARPGILERLLLRRGSWHACDVSSKLDIFQALNNGFNRSWYHARRLWIDLLLSGLRLPLAAGNDSHGDFNRYRSIGIPFVSIAENPDRYLSYSRTGIYGKPSSGSEIIAALRAGRTFVTTGPFLDIRLHDESRETLVGNEVDPHQHSTVSINITSSYEFGFPRLLRVFRGCYDTRKENLLELTSLTGNKINVLHTVGLDPKDGPGYLRAEAVCKRDDGIITQAVTSPCLLI